MVEQDEADLLAVDRRAVIVVLKVVGDVDTARNRAVLELSLHLVGALHVVILTDVITSHVSDGSASVKTAFARRRRRPGTVTANIDVLADAFDIVKGLVVGARSVHEAFSVGKFVDLTRVATIAGAASLAVDHLLGRENNRSSGAETIQDIEAVSDS